MGRYKRACILAGLRGAFKLKSDEKVNKSEVGARKSEWFL